MSLAELIYEKSKDLPDDRAAEVIDFIDFLKTRVRPAGDAALTETARAALNRIAETRIHWSGKPIPSRDGPYDDARG